MLIGSCLLFLDKVPRFLGLAFPFLYDAEAKLSQFCSALYCCKIFFFSCFTVADKFVPVVWKTPRTAVRIEAVILKHGLCARRITVNRRAADPPLSNHIERDGCASPTSCLCVQASELITANRCLCPKTFSYPVYAASTHSFGQSIPVFTRAHMF